MNALLLAVTLLSFDEAVLSRRERMLEMIETVRIAKLTEALDLDTKEAEKLFPAIRPFNERRAEAGRKRRDAMQSLRVELDEETPDEKKVTEHLEAVVEAQRELAKVQEDEYATLKKILDPVTLARYYEFQLEFDREVMGILKEFKAEKAGKAHRGLRFRER